MTWSQEEAWLCVLGFLFGAEIKPVQELRDEFDRQRTLMNLCLQVCSEINRSHKKLSLSSCYCSSLLM